MKDGAITGSKIALSSLPTVPSASHADSATSAQNATNAQIAANAQALQGMSPAQIAATAKLTCPAGTTSLVGTCIETTQRTAATWQTALKTCAKAGRALPEMTQLAAYDILNDNSQVEWSSTFQWFSATTEFGFRGLAMYIVNSGYSLQVINWETGAEPYRCVTPPSS